jgi:hypothetical protein
MNVSPPLTIVAGVLFLITLIIVILFLGKKQDSPDDDINPSPGPSPGPSPPPNPGPGPSPEPPTPPPPVDSYVCLYKSNSGNYTYLNKQSSPSCSSVNNFTLVDTLKTYDNKKDKKMIKFCVYDASTTTGIPNNTYLLPANYFSSNSDICMDKFETAPLVSEFYTYGTRKFESKPLNKNQKTYCIYNYRDTYLKNVLLEKKSDVCSILDRYNSQSEISFVK